MASGDFNDVDRAALLHFLLLRWDNAACESFMKTLQYEEVLRNEYRDLASALAAIPESVEKIYNHKRPHSAIGYPVPAELESAQWTVSGPQSTLLLGVRLRKCRTHLETRGSQSRILRVVPRGLQRISGGRRGEE